MGLYFLAFLDICSLNNNKNSLNSFKVSSLEKVSILIFIEKAESFDFEVIETLVRHLGRLDSQLCLLLL